MGTADTLSRGVNNSMKLNHEVSEVKMSATSNSGQAVLEKVLQQLAFSTTVLAGVQRAGILLSINDDSRPSESKLIKFFNTQAQGSRDVKTYLIWSDDRPSRAFHADVFGGFVKIPEVGTCDEHAQEDYLALSNYFGLEQELPLRGIFPIKLVDGQLLGALGLFDEQSVHLTSEQYEAVNAIAYAANAVILQSQDVQIRVDDLTLMRNAAINNARTGIVITDVKRPDNPIVFANPMFFEMTGYAESEVYGNNCRFLNRGDRDQPGFIELKAAIESGQECCVQLRNYKRDGTMFLNELTLTPIRSESGELTHFMGSQRDVTRHREEESQQILDQKMASIGHLATGIAHEINSPLQFVSNNTSFLKQSFDGLLQTLALYKRFAKENFSEHPGFQRLRTRVKQLESDHLFNEVPDAIAQTSSGIDRITNIVKAIKYFSHPGSTDFVETNLTEIIPATVALCKHEWKYVANVETEFQPNSPNIWCLPGDLNQVILNLLVNACHSIKDRVNRGDFEKGTIKIKASFDEHKCLISMSDTGDGIPLEVRDSLFEPFVTTKSIGQGTGQGLAISRHIIHNKLHGTLSFETEVGCGTTFTIQIPINRPNELTKQSAA